MTSDHIKSVILHKTMLLLHLGKLGFKIILFLFKLYIGTKLTKSRKNFFSFHEYELLKVLPDTYLVGFGLVKLLD